MKTVRLLLTCLVVVAPLGAIIVKAPKGFTSPESLQGLRASSEPYISGDTFRSIADFVIDEKGAPFDTESLQYGSIIFVRTLHLDYFFKQVHPFIREPYILITHNADKGAPGKHAHFLDDDKLIAWFGENSDIQGHPKFFPIPIGFANQYWPHGSVAVIDEARRYAAQCSKEIFLYLNFEVGTNRKVRSAVYSHFQDKDFCHKASRKPYLDYLKELALSKFVICPEGNGLDCHRTWEALVMGAIPVLKHSTLDPLFDGLPVVLIHDWSEVTPEYLERASENLPHQNERIYAAYWLNKIKQLA